ncbi:MAG TPA: transcriptional regulator [Bacteroidales bacterium]|nr:transcriptional regulator [Bacteroidales bacterium]
MKVDISKLNKLFENRVRLGIMSILVVNESYDFNSLKETLDVTDGNLASHLKGLEENGLITVIKQFQGKKPNTSYSATEKGISMFSDHLKALEDIIKPK